MGVSASAVARAVGITTSAVNLRGEAVALLPQRVALIGQGATASTYALTPATHTSAAAVGTAYGFGSPVHLAALQLLPANGDGLGSVPLTVYPLDDDGSGVVSTGDITPSGTQVGAGEYVVWMNGIASAPFTIADAELGTDLEARITTAINANLAMPVVAVAGTDVVNFTSKWAGVSANGIVVSVVGPSNGITFAITQPVGGLVNPSVQGALDQIVSVWETMVVNCMELTDSTALGRYQTWGDGRWGELVKKPALVVTGSTESTLATLTAIGNARLADKINVAEVAPGSANLPLQIAARAVARMAVVANGNPPVDYGGQALTGISPGLDTDQFSYTERDVAVKAGISTTGLVDGVVKMADTVTFSHPAGEDPPAFRHANDIVKLQNIVFNLDVIFNSAEWDGAPLIPDGQATVNPAARSPKAAKTAVNAMLDALGKLAIISDPDTAKAATTAAIDSGDPKRLNVTVTVQLSGNANVISIDLDFGFFFGALAA